MPGSDQHYVLPRGRISPHLPERLARHRDEQVDSRIVLTKGHVSTDVTLGEYYIDFVPSFPNYSEYRYGVFDDDGVPLVRWSSDAYYNPITIAQYGFLLYSLHVRGRCAAALPTLHALLRRLETIKERRGDAFFWRQWMKTRYALAPGFISAMALGEIMSFYLRMYQLTGDSSLLDTAQGAYRFLRLPYPDGGVRRIDEHGDLWFEEYPTDPPSYVLNGFVFCLFGLYDLFRVTGDRDARSDIDSCLKTLRRNLCHFDTGYWSRYDRLTKELVSVYYQRNIHVPQMEALYDLSGDPVFARYAARWRRYLNPLNVLLALVMMRVHARIYPLLRRLCGSFI